MVKKYIILIAYILSGLQAGAQHVKIGLFSKFEVKTLVFKPIKGSFILTDSQGNKEKIKKHDIIYLTFVSDEISVWGLDKHLGLANKISIEPKKDNALFSLEPAFPALPRRRYEGSLEIAIHPDDKLKIVNKIELEKYVASVVEAESGTSAPAEYYKSQAIICRTYALNHFYRHQEEGYNLCDDVHCQVYKGTQTENEKIGTAVLQTRGAVLTDENMQLITAAFHSNSGGFTVNSEDIWTAAMPYLRGKADPYWDNQHNSHWEQTIELEKWLFFLKNIGVTLPENPDYKTLFKFNQPQRTRNMTIDGQIVPLKYVRKEFKLKSTYFSMSYDRGKLILKGRCYGHGVGLSQEGAMQMARQGKSYMDIINFYYTNVNLINIDSTTYLQRLINQQ